MNDLRKALAHEALDRMVAENQRLGLYDDDLQTAIERGTKAWADVSYTKLDTKAGVLHKELKEKNT